MPYIGRITYVHNLTNDKNFMIGMKRHADDDVDRFSCEPKNSNGSLSISSSILLRCDGY